MLGKAPCKFVDSGSSEIGALVGQVHSDLEKHGLGKEVAPREAPQELSQRLRGLAVLPGAQMVRCCFKKFELQGEVVGRWFRRRSPHRCDRCGSPCAPHFDLWLASFSWDERPRLSFLPGGRCRGGQRVARSHSGFAWRRLSPLLGRLLGCHVNGGAALLAVLGPRLQPIEKATHARANDECGRKTELERRAASGTSVGWRRTRLDSSPNSTRRQLRWAVAASGVQEPRELAGVWLLHDGTSLRFSWRWRARRARRRREATVPGRQSSPSAISAMDRPSIS